MVTVRNSGFGVLGPSSVGWTFNLITGDRGGSGWTLTLLYPFILSKLPESRVINIYNDGPRIVSMPLQRRHTNKRTGHIISLRVSAVSVTCPRPPLIQIQTVSCPKSLFLVDKDPSYGVTCPPSTPDHPGLVSHCLILPEGPVQVSKTKFTRGDPELGPGHNRPDPRQCTTVNGFRHPGPRRAHTLRN